MAPEHHQLGAQIVNEFGALRIAQPAIELAQLPGRDPAPVLLPPGGRHAQQFRLMGQAFPAQLNGHRDIAGERGTVPVLIISAATALFFSLSVGRASSVFQ